VLKCFLVLHSFR